jgi:phospholipid/cholesterol/gamma-HCH transport system substrate-binding protein
MKKESLNKIKLGIFVSIGVVIFILGIYFIGETKKLFSSTFRVNALFRDVNGLQVGNNVRFAGINVGSVEKIEILTDSTVKVDMVIDVDTQKFIKKDAKAIIATDGLMGNKIMVVSPGTMGNPMIEDNDRIGTTIPMSIEDMLFKLKTTGDNAAIITNDLAEIFGSIKEGKGTVGKLFSDDEFANNLDAILVNLKKGTDGFGQTFDKDFSNNLDSILINVKDGTEGFKKTMDAAKDSWLLGSFFGGDSDEEEEEKKLKEEQDKKNIESLKLQNNLNIQDSLKLDSLNNLKLFKQNEKKKRIELIKEEKRIFEENKKKKIKK